MHSIPRISSLHNLIQNDIFSGLYHTFKIFTVVKNYDTVLKINTLRYKVKMSRLIFKDKIKFTGILIFDDVVSYFVAG